MSQCDCNPVYPFCATQRATFVQQILFYDTEDAPVNLTGYSADLQVRETALDTIIILEASTTNGYITINGSLGIIDIQIPIEVMDDVPAPFTGVYQLFITSPDDVRTCILQGKFNIIPAVAR